MTNVALTGAENELFSPISDVDRTMGAFDARLVYPALLRDDKAALYGANVIVSQMPSAPNQSILMMSADFYGQQRASFMERVEAYRVPTTESRMTLLGTQRKGSRVVQAYQNEHAPLPVVGQSFALRLSVNGQYVFEFIRVESFSEEIRTFEDDKGEFARRVLKIITPQALSRDFVGLENASRYNAKPDVRVLDTQIADSAKYYGIKPLKEALAQGSGSLKLPSLYEQLVPVSVVETTLSDSTAQGRECWIETAPRAQVLFSSYGMPASSYPVLYLESGVLPGSVQVGSWVDDGQGTLKNGEMRASIDYENGVIRGNLAIWLNEISAIPAVKVRQAAYSAYLDVDDTNIGTEWVFAPMRPRPARGSVCVSFRASGQWYDLIDRGDYQLRDATGQVRGEVSNNGTVSISLPAPPDSGSQIIATWAGRDFYHAFDGKDAGVSAAPKEIATQLCFTIEPNLKPSSVKLSWTNGSAQDNGKGAITGGVSGSINYATGEVRLDKPVGAQIQVQAEQYSQASAVKSVAVADGNSQMSLIAGELQQGSLKIELMPTLKTSSGHYVSRPIMLTSASSK